MRPFYYKGILFSNETSDLEYAKGVDKLNDICSRIEYGTIIPIKRQNKEEFRLCFTAPINDRLFLLSELSDNGQQFGVYDKKDEEFKEIKIDDLMKINKITIDDLQQLAQKYTKAIERGDIGNVYTKIAPTIKQKWEMRKFDIRFQIDADVINQTIDADFITSRDNHMNYHHRQASEMVSVMPGGIDKARSQCLYSLGAKPLGILEWLYALEYIYLAHFTYRRP